MFIKRLRAKNFRSFSNLDIELNRLNILIGANASGKSNFIGILEFLRNISNHGLDNAISMEGGVEYLRNMSIGSSEELLIGITYEPKYNFAHGMEREGILVALRHVDYQFSLRFHKRGKGFNIIADKIVLDYEFFGLQKEGKKSQKGNSLGVGQVVFEIGGRGKPKITTNLPPGLSIKSNYLFPPFLERNPGLFLGTLLLETPLFSIANQFQSSLEDIAIYDFDPKLPKKAVSITGKTELEENGSNLSIVLKNIVEDKEEKRKFLNLMQDMLPFVCDARVQKFADRSLLFTLQEAYDKRAPHLPASFISDGTVNIAALIVALYFEDKRFMIIEEPERNIHPYLISRLVSMLKEVSERKQIVITTHNSEFVKHAALEDLFLITRDEHGFSNVSKPAGMEAVQMFLENEMGIDELYIQNLLGVEHAAVQGLVHSY